MKWTGSCFIPTSLFDLGYVLYLGHHGGHCPIPTTHTYTGNQCLETDEEGQDSDDLFPGHGKTTTMTLVDVEGVHSHCVHWCNCDGAQSKDQQLLEAGLFPASFRNPKTAFTFNVLDHFHIDAMKCKTSANNFYSKLRRLSNNVFPDLIPVSEYLEICEYLFTSYFILGSI